MSKTGESYTAARAVLRRATPAPAVPGPTASLAERAGVTDASIAQATGCDWRTWVYLLDQVKAHAWSHRAIAEHVRLSHGASMWWAQTITIGYERIHGRRVVGQRADGSFEATKTRTMAVPTARVWRAFRDSRVRKAWLGLAGVTVRRATADTSVQLIWPDQTVVDVWLEPRPDNRTRVSIAHAKLTDAADVAARKAFWQVHLKALEAFLLK